MGARGGMSSIPEIEIALINKIDPNIQDRLDIDFEKVAAFSKYSPEYSQETKTDSPGSKKLTEAEEKAVKDLEARDKEVREHEQAHISAGGGLVRGGAMFNYSIGPDGNRYAVGGEVHIDMSVEDSPEKTISKMQQVVAAAMAPKDPSAQDYAVAAAARRNENEAKRQLAENAADASAQNTKNTKNTITTRNTNTSINKNIITAANHVTANNTNKISQKIIQNNIYNSASLDTTRNNIISIQI